MRKQFGARNMDAGEYASLVERSGGNVSGYVRDALFNGLEKWTRTRTERVKHGTVEYNEVPPVASGPVPAVPPVVKTATVNSRDLCAGEFCHHFRFEHKAGCCTHGDCRCGGFTA